jgi:tetratricopeptide (TPR) repeat protein
MTELYPLSAVAWGKLGDAQIASGQKESGLKSYKRALVLNPNNLDNIDERHALAERSFARPDSIRFGATVRQMEAVLGNLCTAAKTRPIDPPFLIGVRDRQIQIDCDGFQFQEKARHAEFVFGDDSLKMARIMTSPDEGSALEKAMTGAFGPPNRRNQQYVGYTSARAAIRLDRAEVLFYAKDAEKDVLQDIAGPLRSH